MGSISPKLDNTIKNKNLRSLESDLTIFLTLIALTIYFLLTISLYLSDVSALLLASGVFFAVLLTIPLFAVSYLRIIAPLRKYTSVIENVRNEEYSLKIKSKYKRGVIAQLQEEVTQLSSDLQLKKDRYHQHIFLIYRLIEQLDTPVMVFKHDLRLEHANTAFGSWLGKPWEAAKGYSAQSFGLEQISVEKWVFLKPEKHHEWQIKNSRFIDNNEEFHLVILNNIEKEAREIQVDSWHQIIRVMSHEIRNSLTPIQSLSQSLIDLPDIGERYKSVLEVIYNRSKSLQVFIDNYACLSNKLEPRKEILYSADICNRLKALFSDVPLSYRIEVDTVWADSVLLDQVLINIIKNANDAQASINCNEDIMISFSDTRAYTRIIVSDHGCGISNPENLFVPFYTTKKNGKGIGLMFSRNIVEKHGGKLSLENRKSNGVDAIISLPKPAS